MFTKVNMGHSRMKYLTTDFYIKFCCISCYPAFLTPFLSKSMTDLHYSNTNFFSSLFYHSILKGHLEGISLKYNRGNMKKISFIVWRNYLDNSAWTYVTIIFSSLAFVTFWVPHQYLKFLYYSNIFCGHISIF